MEQFVLGLFQEQLSKIIIGFRKEQINANLLNGKGEITDVTLNCSVINENVRRISPLLEFEEIHLSRLGFHVTAWANLRKAPIAVDIGVVTVIIKEPMECVPKKYRRRLQILTERELVELILNGLKPFRGSGSYGFADRIVDNLTIEIEALKIHMQVWGKFKTKRKGPWTPPELQIIIEHLKAVAVDEFGHEAPPDQVWAHNRMGMKHFMLYKKVSGEVHVKVLDAATRQAVDLVNHLKFENQMAVKRRLRDGAILGVQADLTIPLVDIEIEATEVPILAHLIAALQHCLGKEKSFEDPLRADTRNSQAGTMHALQVVCHPSPLFEKEEGSIDDDSENDEHEDENSEDYDTLDGGSDGSTSEREFGAFDEQSQAPHLSHSVSLEAPYKERPLVLLPNGIVIFESVCFTCSIQDVTIRGIYPSGRNGSIQLTSKGCITEFIWPQVNNEPGVYLQASVSFMSMQERLDQNVRTILLGGITHGDHMSIHQPYMPPREVPADENFPMFERRSLRDDPLELRHTFPSQAFGTKVCVDMTESMGESDISPMVLLEIGVDEFDVVLDADAWCRALGFFLNEHGGCFDPRWHTGDWTEFLTQDMLKDPGAVLHLDEHLQIAKPMLLDENFMLSSDRFNVTARLSNMELRVPAAVTDNVRSCDVLIQMQHTMLIVSSALPRTFLIGKIGNSIRGGGVDTELEVDFPNDPRDIAYTLRSTDDPSLRLSGVQLPRSMSTCRLQLTMREFQVKTIPVIPFCDAAETQRLISPLEVTMIVCFDGELPPPGGHLSKIALYLSIQVYNFSLNVDFDLLAGSASTLVYHYHVAREAFSRIAEGSPVSQNALSVEKKSSERDLNDQAKKNFKGRIIMIMRHLARTQEAGGLSVVFCMQLAKVNLTMWRQNVPCVSPFRKPATVDAKELDKVVRLLKLMEIQATEFEIGIELDFQSESHRRTVTKCCIEDGRLLVCNVNRALGIEPPGSWIISQHCLPGEDRGDMVELVVFGKSTLPGQLNQTSTGTGQHVAIRLEEQMKESKRSWSFTVDINCQAIINVGVEEVKDSLILCLEELLLPTWSKREFPLCGGAPFPRKTIGAMLHYMANTVAGGASPGPSRFSRFPEEDLKPDNIDNSNDPMLERALRMLCERFLPSDLSLILFRIEIANLLLSIPDAITTRDPKSLGLHVTQTDLVVRFYPKTEMTQNDMEDIVTSKGVVWSSLIKSKGEPYYQSFTSRQSLLSITNSAGELDIEELVHPFRIELTYCASHVHLSMDEDLKIKDIRRLESFTRRVKAIGEKCVRYQSDVLFYLQIMKQTNNRVGSEINPHAPPVAETNKSVCQQGELGKAGTRYDLGNIRRLIHLAQSELGHYQHDVRDGLKRNIERISALQRQVFAKEKERFAALALSMSRAAGWVRSGGAHRTGQRVMRKATLWPHWAVLRKNLLILYHSPADPRPVDVILLDGSKLRQLSGGNSRQDLKRGFAIIERGGTTRYFIVANSREFSRWVQSITETIHAYSDAGAETGLSLDAERNMDVLHGTDGTENLVYFEDGDPAEGSREEEKPERGSRLGARIAGARNRIGAALENAKQKGKEIAEGRIDTTAGGEFLSATRGGSEDVDFTAGEMDEPAGAKRRIQLGKTFSGMKEATRSKFGTAILHARQKVPETRHGRSVQVPPRAFAGVRNKLKGLSPGLNSADLGSQDTSFGVSRVGADGQRDAQTTCEACTYISSENGSTQACEICGSTTASENDLNQGQVLTYKSGEGAESIDNGAPNEGSKRGRFSAIGSAVRNATQSRLSRPRVIESSSDSFHYDAPLTLKSVQAGSLEVDVGTKAEEKVTLKILEGNWYVSVVAKPGVNGNSPRASIDTASVVDGASLGDATQNTSSTEVLLTSSHLEENSTNMNDVLQQGWDLESPVFILRSQRLDGAVGTAHECHCSYGSLFRFHSKVSESVGQLLYSGFGFGKTAVASERGLMDFNIVDLVDNVLITGRVLGGVLETEISAQSVERMFGYHAELLAHFINAILRCPLPVDVLLDVSEFLGIAASTKEQTSSSTEPTNDPEGNDTLANTDRPRRILTILSACETEVLRAMNAEIMYTPGESGLQPIEDPIPAHGSSPPQLDFHAQLYDPLLPPLVSGIMQEAMHTALVNAMAERDQAHAQLISSNVQHLHELEQERRKLEKLKMHQIVKDERGRLQQPNVASFFQNLNDERSRRGLHMKLDEIEKMLAASNDSELFETSRQLAQEVSAKTSNALEVVRLKEVREIEKKNYDTETQALKEELRRIKALLIEEKARAEKLEKIVSAHQNS